MANVRSSTVKKGKDITAVIIARKNVQTAVIITLKNADCTRRKMTKIDLDMKYILELYFSREHELDLNTPFETAPNSEEIQFKIENIVRFGNGTRKILALKLLKLLEMATAEFSKEADKED